MCNFVDRNKNLFDELDGFINSLPTKNGALIQVLHHAQGIFGYLPREVQLYVAEKLDLSPAKVYGVVSFYSYFTTEPKGEYKISVCLGTVCFVKGSDKILEKFEDLLGIKSGETTKDSKFSLEGLRCVGACGLAPVVVVNGKVYGHVKLDQVEDIINEYKALEVNC
ncbi:NAD(P)H-dependent oxidoreductase subunit E [Romboutsia weinsteinii]|uniref:NAD(P)H-dependent oxidoreductase subunit E n=1 Tax=Romboutsia weinsteinii TaxID=2020949 RepID=A0A371IZQ6_9FIRM|nr:NAD(P)H-dependent oxidoreductase subunit E [Romboutsia weinsteinii]RDY25955.1 NAD(P)H-dependent oxidoreductase subunit E [Romboutsia weinsteinii]